MELFPNPLNKHINSLEARLEAVETKLFGPKGLGTHSTLTLTPPSAVVGETVKAEFLETFQGEPTPIAGPVKFTSSNEKVATVSETGDIIVAGEGHATITALDARQGLTSTAVLEVLPAGAAIPEKVMEAGQSWPNKKRKWNQVQSAEN
jgi:Bacterial Ig-like domain (group 2)